MKESTAWRMIAMAYSLPMKRRTENQKCLAGTGLCSAIAELLRFHNIPSGHMRRRMIDHGPKRDYMDGYWWDWAEYGQPDPIRSKFAYKMAKLAERDENKLSRHRTKRRK